MQVTSCQRRPALRRVIPGSSPSNYQPPFPTQQTPPAVVKSGGEGRPRIRQYGREDADTVRRWSEPRWSKTGRVEGGRSVVKGGTEGGGGAQLEGVETRYWPRFKASVCCLISMAIKET